MFIISLHIVKKDGCTNMHAIHRHIFMFGLVPNVYYCPACKAYACAGTKAFFNFFFFYNTLKALVGKSH